MLLAVHVDVTGCAFQCYWLCITILLAVLFDVFRCYRSAQPIATNYTASSIEMIMCV